jgi:hypothetical protein
MITGSGQIRRYRVGLSLTGRIRLRYAVRAREPLGRGGGGGWAPPKIRPRSRIQIRKHFSFSKLFYKLQINLNSNQISNFNDFYSHNKIQDHFVTPRKICNGMNAINNYLFKYITL